LRDRSPGTSSLRHCVEEFADATSVLGRNGKQLFRTKRIKRRRMGLEFRNIDLVGHHPDGLSRPAQDREQLLVRRGHAGAAVHQEKQKVRFADGRHNLFQDFLGDDLLDIRHHTPGIENLEAAAAPGDSPINAIARDAGLIADNRLAGATQSVEKSRFADIGPADDRNSKHVR
jgi:hypothetical protein